MLSGHERIAKVADVSSMSAAKTADTRDRPSSMMGNTTAMCAADITATNVQTYDKCLDCG
ncbi:hypothetical protein [Ornithinimicrobium sp. INDO-MA30-4]|uniref:hypothetical protein n=1 Tax=Ornithinimicrobium sp. INDO-MA30-4 TaxID=2908651 RepID=UPI001F15EB17|nr:hypothetical protein [Ornithinimicrobium sp. INDO-MA30-4]UJH69649.1 hypothetical protein L0A91_09910 [Ornithinimicrobium sp. INDO-MA30-4]